MGVQHTSREGKDLRAVDVYYTITMGHYLS